MTLCCQDWVCNITSTCFPFIALQDQTGCDDLWKGMCSKQEGKGGEGGCCSIDLRLNVSYSFLVQRWWSCHYRDTEGKQNTHMYAPTQIHQAVFSFYFEFQILVWIQMFFFSRHFKNNIWIQFNCKQAFCSSSQTKTISISLYHAWLVCTNQGKVMSHKFSKKKTTRMSFPVFLVRGKKPDEEHADPQSWRISVTPPSSPGLPEQQPGQKQSLETKVISRNQQTVWCVARGDSRMFLLNIIQSRVCSDECSLHDICVLQQHLFFFFF